MTGFCPYCGTDNPADYRFCYTCKKELPQPPTSARVGAPIPSTPSTLGSTNPTAPSRLTFPAAAGPFGSDSPSFLYGHAIPSPPTGSFASTTERRIDDPLVKSAKNYALAGVIWQIVAGTVNLLLAIAQPFLFLLGFFIGPIAIALGVVSEYYLFSRIRSGNLEGAQEHSLGIGIAGIFFGGIIPGILYLTARSKLKQFLLGEHLQSETFQPPHTPRSRPASSLGKRPCPFCGQWGPSESEFCHKCGKPLPSVSRR